MLTQHKALFRKGPEALARLFLKLGFTPNGITIFGLVLGLLTCVWFVFAKNPVLFGIIILFWGLFDLVDGAAARLSGNVTKFGSYLDAMCDRIYESAVAFTTAYVTGYWALLFIATCGGQFISYAKARTAMEISIENNKWPDFMERIERSLTFVAGLILWGIFPQEFFGHDILYWVLIGMNIAIYFTVIQRILRAKGFINSQG